MRHSISIFIFLSLITLLHSTIYVEKYGSVKIDNCYDLPVIALDVSDFDESDNIYFKISFDEKNVKNNLIVYNFGNYQGEYRDSHEAFEEFCPLTFAKPGTTNKYYKIEKTRNSHYLYIISDCHGSSYKFEHLKNNEGLIHFIIIVYIIVIGSSAIIITIVLLLRKFCCKRNSRKKKQMNTPIQQLRFVTVKNDNNQNLETNQNEIRLSLNNKINKNDINIIPTIQNTENENIPSKENLEEKNQV